MSYLEDKWRINCRRSSQKTVELKVFEIESQYHA